MNLYKRDWSRIQRSKGTQSLIERWTATQVTIDTSSAAIMDDDGELLLKRNVLLRSNEKLYRVRCVSTKCSNKFRPSFSAIRQNHPCYRLFISEVMFMQGVDNNYILPSSEETPTREVKISKVIEGEYSAAGFAVYESVNE